jgi:hypothetical protein
MSLSICCYVDYSVISTVLRPDHSPQLSVITADISFEPNTNDVDETQAVGIIICGLDGVFPSLLDVNSHCASDEGFQLEHEDPSGYSLLDAHYTGDVCESVSDELDETDCFWQCPTVLDESNSAGDLLDSELLPGQPAVDLVPGQPAAVDLLQLSACSQTAFQPCVSTRSLVVQGGLEPQKLARNEDNTVEMVQQTDEQMTGGIGVEIVDVSRPLKASPYPEEAVVMLRTLCLTQHPRSKRYCFRKVTGGGATKRFASAHEAYLWAWQTYRQDACLHLASSTPEVAAEWRAPERAMTEPHLPPCSTALLSRTLANEEKVNARVLRLCSGPASEMEVVRCFGFSLTQRLFKSVAPRTWLNDEIISFYMLWMAHRDLTIMQSYPETSAHYRQSHFYNNGFISLLLDNETGEYDYSKVRRWSKNFDTFAMEKIFCPINIANTHWTLAVIYIREKRVKYFDSVGNTGERYVNGLLRYLQDEHQDKKHTPLLDLPSWNVEYGSKFNCPQQQNDFD